MVIMEYTFSSALAELKPSAIREIFKVLGDPEVISFAAGNPAPETFPSAELAEISDRIWRERPGAALQYGLTEGYAPLREAVTQRLRGVYGIGGGSDAVIMTSGGQQGVQLAAMTLCDPGDTVLCETPSFIGSLNAFRALGLRPRGVEMDEEGILPDSLEHTLKTQPRVKMLYTIPTFQNPSGITMTAERRAELLSLCERYGVMAVEDNPYSDLYYDGKPPAAIKSMDTAGRVIYAGSFSKVISPGLRVGFVCGPAPIVEKMVVAKQGIDVHTPQFTQMLVHEYISRHDLDAHIVTCRDLYRVKRDRMLNACERSMSRGVNVVKPSGGLFLWCSLKDGADGVTADSAPFCRAAAAKKVAVVPGSAFLADTEASTPGFRMNFSLPSPEQIDKGVEILSSLL